jgi:hypothetical protein
MPNGSGTASQNLYGSSVLHPLEYVRVIIPDRQLSFGLTSLVLVLAIEILVEEDISPVDRRADSVLRAYENDQVLYG